MNPHQLKRLFPNASQSVLQANSYNDTGTTPKLESNPGSKPLGKNKVKKGDKEKFHISVLSVRKRLCDTDNLACKYHVDCLRYLGLIPDDSPDYVQITTTQRKCKKGEEEHIVIEILLLNDNLKS